ncbi:RICIN domain-containing protein [Niveibacterium sp. SC-1]|uniref:RICIN domain-containing protein n=1 Tax=Niveibacterium sp. SC-1 TaxID=3135646 RepID=UPI00311E1A29
MKIHLLRPLAAGALAALALSAAAEQTLVASDAFYPRAIRLQANGAANGRLIASVDTAGQGRIFESTDDGASWHVVGTADDTEPWSCCSGLFEVPRQLGSTPAGTLFWATSTKNGNSAQIRIYKSTNQGRNWSYLSTPVAGNTGTWEPEFIVDAQGRLLMFYSSEEYKSRGYNQLLTHRVSTDGGLTWGLDVFDVAVADGQRRPGMALVRKLPNGRYVMSYEICGGPNDCDVFVRSSADGANWGNPTDLGARVESTRGRHFQHAPAISWANDGSANGKLVVVGQVLQENSSNAITNENGRVMMINTNGGAGAWVEATKPLYTNSNGSDACTNYSTQLMPTQDGSRVTEIANIGCRMASAQGPLPGAASPTLADGVYRLVAKHSGKVLDVAACSNAVGANVQQWSWLGGDCQRWKVTAQTDGTYVLTSQRSGQALDVAGCSTATGADVRQWTANGADCQKWRAEPVGDGYFRLVAKHSGKVLDVAACSTADGADVRQWDSLGSECQKWKFEPVSANSIADGAYKLIAKHSGKALDVTACSTADGANAQQWTYWGGACQIWNLRATPDGYYELASQQSGKLLEVANCSTDNGGNVRQWPRNGAACQRWGLENLDDGFVRLVSKNGGKVLDVAACNAADGANVQQWEWLGGDCQRWKMSAP